MDNLSHWDFAEQFKAKEAAELIVGIPPELNTQLFSVMGDEAAYTAKITPILRRMRTAFDRGLNTLDAAISFGNGGFEFMTNSSTDLHSELMLQIRENKNYQIEPRTYLELHLFERAFFNRSELQRWLSTIGMKSVYQFDRSQPPAIEKVSGHWPWGDHHTELLGHLEAAAKRYWVNYEPTDATTAPTNKDVAEWLVTERKVSQKMAESIASMLRPDGLATGPRK